MPSSLTCSCGRVLRVKEGLAGKKARCPGCQAVLLIPEDEPAKVDDEASNLLLGDSIADRPREPARHEPDLPDPIQRPLYQPPSKALGPAPAKKREPLYGERRAAPPVTFERGWFGSTNAGMIGGMLMIVIAIVWFVVGLMAGFIFFYPPILLIIGVIAFLRGVFSRR